MAGFRSVAGAGEGQGGFVDVSILAVVQWVVGDILSLKALPPGVSRQDNCSCGQRPSCQPWCTECTIHHAATVPALVVEGGPLQRRASPGLPGERSHEGRAPMVSIAEVHQLLGHNGGSIANSPPVIKIH